MNQIELLAGAMAAICTQLDALLGVIIGSVAGLILGATPGLTAVVGMVLLIPFTFYMTPLAGISMLYAIHKSGNYGGSIPAILMNTPGSPAAACTQMDGYPLTLQGKQGKALKVAVTASALGDLLSDMVLIFGTVYIARVVYAFGPVEMAAVLFFSLTLIGTITGASILKGLTSTALGLLLGTVGLDPMQATPRFSFGVTELEKSLDVIPVLVGVFVVSEVLVQAEKRAGGGAAALAPRSGNPADSRLSFREFKSILPATGLSYLVGQVIGILPGLGGAVAPWIAYGQVRGFSRHPEEFGRGSLKGVAAAEASNNAVCGANLMPTLTLGVPGSTDAAIIMGAFLIHGLELGPRIFTDQAPLVYGIFAAGLLAIVIYFLIGFFLAEWIGRVITSFPRRIFYPLIMITCFIGAYAPNTSLFDVGVMQVNHMGNWVFLQAHTDAGMTGLGEASHSFDDALLLRVVAAMGAQIAGCDPFDAAGIPPNFYRLEHAWREVPWRAELLEPTERFEAGRLVLSSEPGIGHRLNMALVRRHLVPL